MRVPGRWARPYHSGPNMTPLVDVVLVLLIFLMLVGNFATAEHVIASQFLAQGKGPPAVDPGRQLDVYVCPSSTGEFIARMPDGVACDVTGFSTTLMQRRAAYSQAGTSPDSVLVLLHPSGEPTWGAMAAAQDAAKLAGFTRVSFTTR